MGQPRTLTSPYTASANFGREVSLSRGAERLVKRYTCWPATSGLYQMITGSLANQHLAGLGITSKKYPLLATLDFVGFSSFCTGCHCVPFFLGHGDVRRTEGFLLQPNTERAVANGRSAPSFGAVHSRRETSVRLSGPQRSIGLSSPAHPSPNLGSRLC